MPSCFFSFTVISVQYYHPDILINKKNSNEIDVNSEIKTNSLYVLNGILNIF